jgi:hypothetical protein
VIQYALRLREPPFIHHRNLHREKTRASSVFLRLSSRFISYRRLIEQPSHVPSRVSPHRDPTRRPRRCVHQNWRSIHVYTRRRTSVCVSIDCSPMSVSFLSPLGTLSSSSSFLVVVALHRRSRPHPARSERTSQSQNHIIRPSRVPSRARNASERAHQRDASAQGNRNAVRVMTSRSRPS